MEDIAVEMLTNIEGKELRRFSYFYKDLPELCFASSYLDNIHGANLDMREFLLPTITPESSRTIIAILKIDIIYEIRFFSLFLESVDVQDTILYCLQFTKKIPFDIPDQHIVFKDISTCFHSRLIQFMESKNLEVEREDRFYVFQLFKNKALGCIDIELPNGLQMKTVSSDYVAQIHKHWPRYYSQTEEYFRLMIERCPGYGIFSEENELFSWGFITVSDTIDFVQTVPTKLRQGYAEHIVRRLAKELILRSKNPAAIVPAIDIKARRLFKKCGFKIIERTHNIHLKPKVGINDPLSSNGKAFKKWSKNPCQQYMLENDVPWSDPSILHKYDTLHLLQPRFDNADISNFAKIPSQECELKDNPSTSSSKDKLAIVPSSILGVITELTNRGLSDSEEIPTSNYESLEEETSLNISEPDYAVSSSIDKESKDDEYLNVLKTNDNNDDKIMNMAYKESDIRVAEDEEQCVTPPSQIISPHPKPPIYYHHIHLERESFGISTEENTALKKRILES